MMTVAELAKKSGATADAVRYYTRMGLLQPERNPANGYRLYKPKEVTWLRFIRHAKALGFTLHEIQRIMESRNEGHSPCPDVRAILQNRIVENRQHLKELMALQDRMEKALLQWADMPDGEADDQSVCPLIESVISPKENQGKNK
jgi:DNA-binding transcriptional MerR regulator